MNILDEMEKYINDEYQGKSFYKIYPFTTENIDGYIDLFNLKNKSLLTVGSSFDQIINASLKECKNITSLDICHNSKYYYYLKIAALLELNRKEFLEFLCGTNYTEYHRKNLKLFNRNTFEKIKDKLEELDCESYIIWEYLFSIYDGNKIRKLFTNDELEVNNVIKYNTYLKDDDNYNFVKSKIKNTKVTFINGSVLNIKLEKNYDNIWLSNIGKYLTPDENVTMLDNVTKYTNDKLLAMYFYNNIDDKEYSNIKEKYDLEEVDIPIYKYGINDKVFIYTKK